jgi:hypothetical protein
MRRVIARSRPQPGSTGRRVRVGSLAGLLVASLALCIVGGQGVAGASPSLLVSPSTAMPGEIVQITATGLAPSSVYSVQICGAAAQTSSDCILTSSQTGGASDSGVFTTSLQVEIPPAPCPCVVAAFSEPDVHLALTSPIQIVGAPTSPVVQNQPARLVVRDAHISGSDTWAERFGAAAKRTLVLTVANTGGTAAQTVSATVSVDGTPSSPPPLAGLQPGQQRTYQVPVTFPTLSVGHQPVTGLVSAQTQNASMAGLPAGFRTSTALNPWGLYAVGALLALLLLLLLVSIIVHLVRLFRDWRRGRRAAKAAKRAGSVPRISGDQASNGTGPMADTGETRAVPAHPGSSADQG